MIFITIEELKIRKFQSLVNDVSEDNDYILNELESFAIDEIKSYLKGRYDVEFIFNQKGIKRSPIIRRIATDMMMCMLWERTNSNEIPDSMQERCDKNTTWLKDVSKGIISPDLPVLDPKLEATTIFQGASESQFTNIDNID